MRIQYCSDLHLEFKANNDFLKLNPLQPVGDVLILAGDVVPFAHMDKFEYFFNYVSNNFQATYWIPGNHEYYHYDLANKSGVINEQIRSNVFLVNNIEVDLENIKFLFTTLWTNILPANQLIIQRRLNDFNLIRFDGNKLTTEIYNKLHHECLEFLSNALKSKDDYKTIVVTHHVPTISNYPEEYKHGVLNNAFAVEMYDFIEPSSIDFWIYGHHHINAQDFKIGKTQMLTNQLGYLHKNEHLKYRSNAYVQIK